MMGIYKITNKLNNKCYIGSSKTLKKRLKYEHKAVLNKNKHWNEHLQLAWNKYGQDSFIFEIIENVSNEDLLIEREQYWMDYYKSYDRKYGYNISPKADRSKQSKESILKGLNTKLQKYGYIPSGMKGKHHSQESKDKISSKNKGKLKKPLSEETKQKISNSLKGRTYIEMYGKDRTEEIISKRIGTYEEKYGKEKAKQLIEEKQKSLIERYGQEKAQNIKHKMGLAHSGFKHSEESKSVMSETKKGIKNPQYISIDIEKQDLIIKEYINNNYQVTKKMATYFNISIYKITALLKERGFYHGRDKTNSNTQEGFRDE